MIDAAANYARVRERVHSAARAAGRRPEDVQLVVVSKTVGAAMVQAVVAAGARLLGENYVQEAVAKIPAVGAGPEVSWHLIGHLQRNKAAGALELFDVIQTLDSARLAQRFDQLAQQRGRPVRTLVEVNTGGEATKGGVTPGELRVFLEALASYQGVRVEGLMTIPPPQPDPVAARPFFQVLRRLRDELAPSMPPNVVLRELSMGMTDDFEIAIAEGATMVRVGRAIFGERR